MKHQGDEYHEEAGRRFKKTFADIEEEQRTAICDDICYVRKAAPRYVAAAKFFARFRDLTAEPGPFRLRDLWSARRGGRDLGIHQEVARLALAPQSVRLLRMEAVAGNRS